MSFSIIRILDSISYLDDQYKYLIYSYLHDEIKSNERELLPISQNANDAGYLTSLLTKKKEVSFEELNLLLPYLQYHNIRAKKVILQILPVFLSYTTLYEMRTSMACQILDIIKIHSAFAENQHLFAQWFTIFDRRKNAKSRTFSFKDEVFVTNLPAVDEISGDPFVRVVGYNNVALLRAFHRWLRLHRLHKYLYLFSNLTYEQILSITEENIERMQNAVGLLTMTVGARNKILREVEELRKRKSVLLDNVIKKNFQSLVEVDQAIRDIKRILRSPMQVTTEENLPNLLVQALSKMCQVVLHYVGTGEGIIPIYGLLISVLKESWNYSIFSPNDKDRFNLWRNSIFEKINNNYPANKNMMEASDIVIAPPSVPDIVIPPPSATPYLSRGLWENISLENLCIN